jgi:hypothetical protein
MKSQNNNLMNQTKLLLIKNIPYPTKKCKKIVPTVIAAGDPVGAQHTS